MGFDIKAYKDSIPKITAEQINKKIKEICPECNCKVYDIELPYNDPYKLPYHKDECLSDELFHEAYDILKKENSFFK
jgi:hypothetical protein